MNDTLKLKIKLFIVQDNISFSLIKKWFFFYFTDFLKLAPGYPGEKDQKKPTVDKSQAFNEDDDSEPIKIDKSNILLLGPTGSGDKYFRF